MKKSKFIIFYTIFASLVFIASLSYLGFNLYNEYNHGYIRTKRRFEHFSNNVQKISEKEYKSMNDYRIALEKAIGDINDFSFLEIKENNRTIYIYPTRTSVPTTDSNLILNYSEYFYVNDIYFNVTADLYILRPSSIFYYSKLAFLIILVITIITIIIYIYYSIKGPDYYSYVSIKPENKTNNNDFSQDIFNSVTEKIENKNDKILVEQKQNIDEESSTISPSKNEEIQTVTVTVPETPQQEENIQDKTAIITTTEIESNTNDNTLTSGLYSPITGLGFENNLIPRLNKEIDNAISSEFDVSLILLKFPELTKNDSTFIECCNLIDQMLFKDALFEYKDNCIAVIKMNENLENALDFAYKILEELKYILGHNNKAFVGITSRNFRMISGDRLLNEACQALKHAQETPDEPIVAFRANAEKYRQYIESQ